MIKCPRKLDGHDRQQSREDSHADHKPFKVGQTGRLPHATDGAIVRRLDPPCPRRGQEGHLTAFFGHFAFENAAQLGLVSILDGLG